MPKKEPRKESIKWIQKKTASHPTPPLRFVFFFSRRILFFFEYKKKIFLNYPPPQINTRDITGGGIKDPPKLKIFRLLFPGLNFFFFFCYMFWGENVLKNSFALVEP